MIDEEFIQLLCEKREVQWDGRCDYHSNWKYRLVVYNYNTMKTFRVELDDTMTQEQAITLLKIYGVPFDQ
jgi:hypothetical protein